MRINVLSSVPQINDFKNEWDGLLEQADSSFLSLHCDWFQCAYDAFHSNDRIHIVTVYDANKTLLCVAPLVIVTERYRLLTIRKLVFPRNNQSPSNNFLIKSGYSQLVYQLLLPHLFGFSEWDMVDLQMLNREGEVFSEVTRYLNLHGHFSGTKSNRMSPFIPIDRSWDDFWAERSTKFKKTMRNKINRISKNGYEVVKISFNVPNPSALEKMYNISSKSWKNKTGTDLSSQPQNWNFYQRLTVNPKFADKECVYFLKLGDELVAFEFHISDRGVVYPIRADYDESYDSLSPGSILEYEILKMQFADAAIREYDSCGHTYQYLLNWTDKSRNYTNLEVFNKSPFGWTLYWFEYNFMPFIRKYQFYTSLKKALTKKEL